jgi:hypothetical protein
LFKNQHFPNATQILRETIAFKRYIIGDGIVAEYLAVACLAVILCVLEEQITFFFVWVWKHIDSYMTSIRKQTSMSSGFTPAPYGAK